MQKSQAVASFRKLTPAIIASQNLAMANDIVETTKAEVSIAIKKAAPALGIDGTAYHLLDILIGLSAADDWLPNRRPLVAISNEKLAEYVCRSQRTVSRSIKRLVEAGIIAYRDSPTGRRYIHRNEFTNGKYGEIQRGYGFDFSPARQRVHELKAIGTAFTARLNTQKEAKRTVNRLLRSIRDMAELAANEGLCFQSIEKSVAAMDGKAIAIEDRAEVLQSIFEVATALFEVSLNEDSMSCAGDMSDAPYNHTNPQTLKRGNNMQGLARANHFDLSDPEQVGISLAFEEVQQRKAQANPAHKSLLRAPKEAENPLALVSIGLIDAATPNTRELLGDGFECWDDLVDQSDQLRLAIGLSVDGWKQAVAALGTKMAAAVLVVTVEKTLRNPDAISSPAGYFRACVDRARDGKLALSNSLYGLKAENRTSI
ncbi:plasmid replication protein RepC [Pseudovibrio sp. Tun.PSC04-5.I4]|uniref:plasmid replication protein RepC n=1 Tax=Pseudovibrio sp. Tun.PSC04-5.I4 TaxID=1798213 RepID=UPI00088C4768|nr:plasmid replication protein RepC [Pseudovibrio sp. Tun.PSC04-5.I4]SDQ37144.1 replication initiation protein RepC [Pseudovibrio sp. Tun.PSC04-5.I4]